MHHRVNGERKTARYPRRRFVLRRCAPGKSGDADRRRRPPVLKMICKLIEPAATGAREARVSVTADGMRDWGRGPATAGGRDPRDSRRARARRRRNAPAGRRAPQPRQARASMVRCELLASRSSSGDGSNRGHCSGSGEVTYARERRGRQLAAVDADPLARDPAGISSTSTSTTYGRGVSRA